jgi:hypothetical protein
LLGLESSVWFYEQSNEFPTSVKVGDRVNKGEVFKKDLEISSLCTGRLKSKLHASAYICSS